MAHAADPFEPVRAQLAGSFRKVMAGGRPVDGPTPEWVTADGDIGLFGPDSVAWRVHGQLATLVGGLRALLLQTTHPLAMAGVAQHSAFRTDPFGRLQRTAGFLASTTFGTVADAERAIEVVKKVHARVQGSAPDGRPYSASDPHLLTFVHVTEVDSFLAAHQSLGNDHLTRAECDRYVGEMAEVARRLGAEDVPVDVRELRAWLDDVRPELAMGADARRAVWFLLNPPLPVIARPAYGIVTSSAVGLLPFWAQRMLWLPSFPPVDRLAVRPAMRSILALLEWAVGTSPQKEAARQRAVEADGAVVGAADRAATGHPRAR